MRHALLPFVLAFAVLFAAGSAQAAPIQYTVTNLGGSTWEYEYFITNALNTQQGFRVYFDDQDTSNLTLLPPLTPDWDVLLTDPDPALSSDGTYDALALANNPLFTGPFSVSFLWTGAGTPGSQLYDFYTLDASGFPGAFETGQTVSRDENPAPVPEPSSLLLLGTGLAAARKLRRTREPS